MKRFLSILIGSVAMAPWLIMCAYIRYFADDWAYIVRMQRVPSIPYQVLRLYLIWDARPVSDTLNFLCKWAGEGLAGPICAVVLVLWWIALYILLRPVTGRWTAFALSGVVLSFAIASCSYVRESVYWQTGMLTYAFPIMLGTWMMACILSHWRYRNVAAPLLAFLAAGCSESYAFTAFIVLAAVTPLLGFRRTALNALWATAIMIFLIVISPAAAYRSQVEGGHMQFVPALMVGLSSVLTPLKLMVDRAPALVIGLAVWAAIGDRFNLRMVRSIPLAIYWFAVALMTGAVLMAAGWYGMNAETPFRAHIVVQYVMLIALCYGVYVVGVLLKHELWYARGALIIRTRGMRWTSVHGS